MSKLYAIPIIIFALVASVVLLESTLQLAYNTDVDAPLSEEKKESEPSEQDSSDDVANVSIPCDLVAVMNTSAPLRCVLNGTETRHGTPHKIFNNNNTWFDYDKALAVKPAQCKVAQKFHGLTMKTDSISHIRFGQQGSHLIAKWVCLNLSKITGA